MGSLSAHETCNEVYFHKAGELTRGAVLDVGLKCTHSCRFCYYSFLDGTYSQFQGMRRATFRSVADCKEILRGLKANGFLSFDYTGGEPSLHPAIVELTEYAHKELGLRGRMITLGQFLMRKMPSCRSGILIEELLDAGLVNFLFSLHAVSEELFNKITGESWGRLLEAMTFLDKKNFSYTSNTTVFDWNYKHLPDIAREVLKHNIYMHNFIIMNAYYEWNHDGRAFGIQSKYSDILPYLSDAIDLLESNNVAVNIRYAPLCTVRGYEKNLVGGVGVRYDPYEWMNKAGHMGGTPDFCSTPLEMHSSGVDTDWIYQSDDAAGTIARRGGLKLFPATCQKCKARGACDGVDPNYLKTYGENELRPYSETGLYGPVTSLRRRYLPAFPVKMSPGIDMKQVVLEAFRESANIKKEPFSNVAYLGTSDQAQRLKETLPERFTFVEDHLVRQNPSLDTLRNAEIWVRLDPSVIEISDDLTSIIGEAFRKDPDLGLVTVDSCELSGSGEVLDRPSLPWNRETALKNGAMPLIVGIRPSKVPLFSPLLLLKKGWARDLMVEALSKQIKFVQFRRPLSLATVARPPHAREQIRGNALLVLRHRNFFSETALTWALLLFPLSLIPMGERLIHFLDVRAAERIPEGISRTRLGSFIHRISLGRVLQAQ